MKLVKYLLVAFLSLATVACDKDNDPSDDVTSPNNPGGDNSDSKDFCEYYVKYEIDVTSKYSVAEVPITILTEAGETSLLVPKKWDGIFGPFKEPRILRLRVDFEPNTPSYVYDFASVRGRISMCKGNAPFALKAEEFGSLPMSMRYQVVDKDYK